MHGYTRCWLRTSLCWAFVILTLGALRLLLHWYPHWLLRATHRPCSLATATKLLVVVSDSLVVSASGPPKKSYLPCFQVADAPLLASRM